MPAINCMRPPPLMTPMSTTLPAQSALLRARRRAPAPSSTSTSMRTIEGIPAVKPLTETVRGLGIDSQINLNDYRISETRETPPNFDELFASMTLPQNVKRNSRVFHTGQAIASSLGASCVGPGQPFRVLSGSGAAVRCHASSVRSRSCRRRRI